MGTRDLIERFARKIDLDPTDSRPATPWDATFIPAAGPASQAIWQVVSGAGDIVP